VCSLVVFARSARPFIAAQVGVMRRVPADEAADFPVAIYAEFQRT